MPLFAPPAFMAHQQPNATAFRYADARAPRAEPSPPEAPRQTARRRGSTHSKALPMRVHSAARWALLIAASVTASAGDSPQMAPRNVPFVMLGVGGVGSELLRSIVRARTVHAEKYGLRLSAVALCDSSGAVRAAAGSEMSDDDLARIVELKAAGGALASAEACEPRPADVTPSEFLERIALSHPAASGAIVVDCTASDATLQALLAAARSGMRVVTANKKPMTASIAAFEELCRDCAHVRFESTVGAGLPAIASLQRVVASADPVSRVAGSLSGTLGYIFSALQRGESFSAVVSRAKLLGYTEPDPRDDLGGVDVARKALILARVLGLRLEMSDVAVEPLYPAAMGALSVGDFMAALPTLDAGFTARVEQAAAQGKVLRSRVTHYSPLGVALESHSLVSFTAGCCALESLTATDTVVLIAARYRRAVRLREKIICSGHRHLLKARLRPSGRCYAMPRRSTQSRGSSWCASCRWTRLRRLARSQALTTSSRSTRQSTQPRRWSSVARARGLSRLPRECSLTCSNSPSVAKASPAPWLSAVTGHGQLRAPPLHWPPAPDTFPGQARRTRTACTRARSNASGQLVVATG